MVEPEEVLGRDGNQISAYQRAVQFALGPSVNWEHSTLSLSSVQPRTRGLVAGFTLHSHEHGELLMYVEPARREFTDSPLVQVVPGDSDSDRPLMVWQYPADPRLPALQSAVYPEALAIVSGRLGLPGDIDQVQLVGYRPGKRAVVRAQSSAGVFFFKVVRPGIEQRVIDRNSEIAQCGIPVAAIRGSSPTGLVVFDEVPGVELSTAASHRLPPTLVVDQVQQISATLSRVGSTHRARGQVVDSHDWYSRAASDAYPNERELIGQVSRGIERELAASAGETLRRTTIHGDLHVGQAFVNPSGPHQLTGLIDLDGVGRGYAVDDLATFWAHTIATRHRASDPVVRDYWSKVLGVIDNRTDLDSSGSHRLRAGVASQLVAHTLTLDPSHCGSAAALLEDSMRFLSQSR